MKIKSLLMTTGIVLLATACEPGVVQHDIEKTHAVMTGYTQSTNERLNSAAKRAARDGNPAEAAHHYERLYRNNGQNSEAALNYAQVLMQMSNPEKALVVLAPFVNISDRNGELSVRAENPDMLLEYASALLATGEFRKSEHILNAMLGMENAQDLRPQIHNLIGVSLDARGHHLDAAEQYKTAIDTWVGEPVNAMNNYGLNLAHQGYFERSLDMLRKAFVMDPSSEKIAANITMVSDLQSSIHTGNAPQSLN